MFAGLRGTHPVHSDHHLLAGKRKIGLCLAHGARDVSLDMKSLHRFPIEALPSARSLVKTQIEQCEYCFLNFSVSTSIRGSPGARRYFESCRLTGTFAAAIHQWAKLNTGGSGSLLAESCLEFVKLPVETIDPRLCLARVAQPHTPSAPEFSVTRDAVDDRTKRPAAWTPEPRPRKMAGPVLKRHGVVDLLRIATVGVATCKPGARDH